MKYTDSQIKAMLRMELVGRVAACVLFGAAVLGLHQCGRAGKSAIAQQKEKIAQNIKPQHAR